MTDRGRRTQAERVEESTQRLFEAAAALVAEQGYGRTTATQVAERAGYSRELVRVRFGSLQGLMDHLLRTGYEEPMLLPAQDGSTGAEWLRQSADRLSDIAESRPVFLRAVLSLQLEAATSAPELRPLVERFLDAARVALETSIRRGVSDGSLRATLDPPVTARYLMALLIGAAYLYVLSGGEGDPSSAFRAAIGDLVT